MKKIVNNLEKQPLTNLARQIAIYEYMTVGKKVRSEELAEYFKVSKRTIERDLKDLHEANLIQKEEKRKGYTSKGIIEISEISLTDEELAALIVSQKLVEELTDTTFAAYHEKAIQKIRTKSIQSEHTQYFKSIDDIRVYKYIPLTPKQKRSQKKRIRLFSDLHKAIMNRNYLKISYYTWHQKKTIHYDRIEPITFAYYLNDWYLIGLNPKSPYTEESWKRVFFRLESIEKYEILEDRFDPRNRKDVIEGSFEEVEEGFSDWGYTSYYAQWLLGISNQIPTCSENNRNFIEKLRQLAKEFESV